MGKPSKTGVFFAEDEKGYSPIFTYKGFKIVGSHRPVRALLEGERKIVAKAFMNKICEDLFGEGPIDSREDEEGNVEFFDNPKFDELPFANYNGNFWTMSDGSLPDFDVQLD